MSSSSSTTCSDIVCSICLDTCSVTSFADGCLHKFCGRCIFEWAQRSQLCPICRTFFANIITNVTSDTEYEVIPLEDRRVPVSNFIRDSWWTNNFSRNGYPSNRNIFAVRQFPQRTNQFQPSQQQLSQPPQHPLPSSSSEPSRTIEQQPEAHEFLDQATRRMDDLQIDNQPRPRRIIWSSQRYRQFNRQPQPHSHSHPQSQPQMQLQPQPQPISQLESQQQPSLPQPVSNYYNRGQNQPVNSPRHSFNPRPLRPLVGVRQENHQNQNQQHYPQQHYQYQHHYQHQPQPNHHHLNVNYQQPHHHSYHSNSHYSNHIHPHPHSNHPHPHSHPHPHPHHFNPHPNQHSSYKRLSRQNDRQRRR